MDKHQRHLLDRCDIYVTDLTVNRVIGVGMLPWRPETHFMALVMSGIIRVGHGGVMGPGPNCQRTDNGMREI